MTEVMEGIESTEEPRGLAADPPLARGPEPPLAFEWLPPGGAGLSLMVPFEEPLIPWGEVTEAGEVGREPSLKMFRMITSTCSSSKSSNVGVRIQLSDAC